MMWQKSLWEWALPTKASSGTVQDTTTELNASRAEPTPTGCAFGATFKVKMAADILAHLDQCPPPAQVGEAGAAPVCSHS